MKKIVELFKKYKEIIMYLVFGVATTIVNFVVYTVLVEFLSADMTLSNAVAWVVAVTFAFITNKIFVFRSKKKGFAAVFREAVSFYGSRVISGIVEILLPTLLYAIGFNFDLFGIKGFGAKAAVSLIVIILNYIFSKLFVFRKKGRENEK